MLDPQSYQVGLHQFYHPDHPPHLGQVQLTHTVQCLMGFLLTTHLMDLMVGLEGIEAICMVVTTTLTV